ncbi:MAG: methylenetetrahydrofolate--tRNA-(uracil(54)-C(5))-methyltransferase (FADH(2)-oxidizing) TrmFO [Erysipelotrichaceae bacterium]|nr:methylenetetrahydrofolate--tRNA-(uracil(54)-C(5))-methyltransferase (FADH(2)-oxidizing) TrmFO [Erysipelotrichaceae bacterium]
MDYITVIGAGLAGAEAAYQIAKKGIKVKLYEMRPHKDALAHHTDKFGELVCSNSLKSNALDNAAGLLKQEMREMGSLIIEVADACKVEAGQALAVDRELFSSKITEIIKSNPLIEVINEEVTKLPEGIVIIATGPLTSSLFAEEIKKVTNEDSLYFYDAAAPLVNKDSIDFSKAYYKSRYDKGSADYINCPFNKEEFFAFYNELINAKRAPLKEFEKELHFEGCMPIETLAQRNPKTLLFGPLKPVGLERPDGTRPYAVVQLRKDNVGDTLYNIVGFQTNLLWGEQKRVFRMIPGLEKAEFERYGVMHRNTYICAPKLLLDSLQLRENNNIFFAGQISGVEGYIESSATGIIAALNAVKLLKNENITKVPTTTVIGSLLRYITETSPKHFQPMNANYGIMLERDSDKMVVAEKSLEDIRKWFNE